MTIHGQNLASQLSNPSLLRTKGYINGEWVDASDDAKFPVINPATGAQLAEVPNMPCGQVTAAIEAAHAAFPSWSALTAYQRQSYLLKLHAAMESHHEDLALILTAENGKPLAEAKGEIAYGAGFLSWFAAEALRTYGHTVPAAIPNQRNTIIRQPVGVCGLITPWNFPNAMITRKLAPALAAGCTVVVKAPAETPLSALVICALAEGVGIPKGVINVVVVDKGPREAACGMELCVNPLVSKISFTGSTAVGRLLMQQSASTLKKLSFELGGNAAFMVFDDADLDLAVEGTIASKFRASGQTCVCANRIFVQSNVYDEFAHRLATRVKAMKVGNPMDEGVNIGPLVNDRAVDKVERHVTDAVGKGATVVCGGSRVSGHGSFFEPTVLTNVSPKSALTSEETFGPLAALFKFDTEEDVIEEANNTDVGLGGYFYTQDVSRVYRVAEKMQVGMVGVNTGVISQPCIPFGGVKQSGFGREGGKNGIDEYMIEKLITVGNI